MILRKEEGQGGAFPGEVGISPLPSFFDQPSLHTKHGFFRYFGASENRSTLAPPIWHETRVPMEDAHLSTYDLYSFQPIQELNLSYHLVASRSGHREFVEVRTADDGIEQP